MRTRTHSEEDENVAGWLRSVDLEDGGDCGMEIVCLRLRSIMDIHRIPTAGYYRLVRMVQITALWTTHTIEDRGIVEILAELLSIHGCTRDQETEFGPKPGDILPSGTSTVCNDSSEIDECAP